MRDNPLVSVLINNFNYGPFLHEAIESALGQTYPHIEVIVVDDGSTDDSREIIASFGDRIVPVLQDNGGQGAAFNAGFKASRGHVLCFLDSDDVFLPTKVQRVVEVLDEFPEAVWVRHKLAVTDETLRPTKGVGPGFRGSRLTHAKPGTYLEDKSRFVVCSGVAVRRRAAEQFLPIPDSSVQQWRFNADAYVGFWSTVAGPCYSLDESLSYYRRQSHQRFQGSADVARWLEAQIRLEERLSEMWSVRAGRRSIASDVYKHALIVDSLRGGKTWAAPRCRTLVRGVGAAIKLAGANPRLALRQTAALMIAFAAPRMWVTRFERVMGLSAEPVASAPLPAIRSEST